jgi:hypothetical protein
MSHLASAKRSTERADSMSSENFMEKLEANLANIYERVNAEKAAANRAYVLEMTRIEEEERRSNAAAAAAAAAASAAASAAPPPSEPVRPLHAKVLARRASSSRLRAPSKRRRTASTRLPSSVLPPSALPSSALPPQPQGIAFTYKKRVVPAFSMKKGGRATRRSRTRQ